MKSYKVYFLIAFLLLVLDESFAQRKKDKRKEEEAKTEQKLLLTEDQQLKKNYLYFNGLKEKTLGNHELAFDFFRQTLTVDPHDPAVYYEIALAAVKLGKIQEALAYATEAVALDRKNQWYYILLADVYEQQRNYKEATGTYKQLIELYPDRIDFYFEMATMQILNREWNDAIKTYDKIESKIGLNEEVSVQKQKIYLQLGKTDKAVSEIQALINAHPSDAKYYIMLGDLYNSANQHENAFEAYSHALEIDSSNAYIRLALADYYRAEGKYEDSFNQLKLAFANPDLGVDDKIRILASYLPLLKEEKLKEQAFMLAAILAETHSKEAKVHAIYGDLYYQVKKLREARDEYYKAIALKRDVFAVWQNLLLISSELNDNEALLKDSEEALALFPEQTILYYFNGFAKAQSKKHEEAVEVYKKGLKLGTDNPSLEAQLYANLGDSYHELTQYENSDEAYEKSLQIDPNQHYVLNNYAYYLSLREEKLEKAERMSRLSNELEPDNSAFEDTYAWILYKLRRYDEAKEWMEKALQHGGEKSPTLTEHYGDILFKLGMSELAVANWKRAKEFGSKSEFLDKKIADKKLYE